MDTGIILEMSDNLRDSSMKSVLSVIRQLSASSTPVLFNGEKGTGRAFLAELLCNTGSSTEKTFIRLQAVKTSVDLFISTLDTKPDMIFFDEIGEADNALQTALLYYLSNSSQTGGKTRICCSSSQNLEQLVQTNIFNRELYFSLSTLPVTVPPLRERKEDIETLSYFFIRKYGKKYNKFFTEFSKEAMDTLKNAFWQNNITELELCIERAVSVGTPPALEKSDLRLNISQVSGIFIDGDKSLKAAIDCFKKQYIEQVLIEVRWNQTEAAKVLDIQRTYLSRLIKELDIK